MAVGTPKLARPSLVLDQSAERDWMRFRCKVRNKLTLRTEVTNGTAKDSLETRMTIWYLVK